MLLYECILAAKSDIFIVKGTAVLIGTIWYLSLRFVIF